VNTYTDYTASAPLAAGDVIITVADYGSGKVYVSEWEVLGIDELGRIIAPHDSFSPRKPRTVRLTRASKYLRGGVIRHAA